MPTVAMDISQVNDPRRTGIGRVVEEQIHSINWLMNEGRWPLDPPTFLSAWPFRLPDRLLDSLRTHGARLVHLPFSSMYIWRATRLSFWVLRNKPDLLYIPEPIHPGLVGLGRLAVMHYDLIVRHHPETATGHIRFLYRNLMMPTLRRAAAVGVDSEFVRTGTAELLPGFSEKSRVLPVYIHREEAADSTPPEGIDPGTPFALYVGNFMAHKNIDRLLNAFERWHGAGDGAFLPLCMAGRPRAGMPALERRLDDLAGRGIILPVGYLGDDHLEWLYRHARFLAFPSLIEGYGLPIMEAMSRGCPVLTSSGGATEETAGGCAHLVNPRDEESILAGIRQLAGDDVLRKQLAERGLEHARTFTRERHATALLDFLQGALHP